MSGILGFWLLWSDMGRTQWLLGKKNQNIKLLSEVPCLQENISVLVEWVMLEEEGIANRNIRTLFHSL